MAVSDLRPSCCFARFSSSRQRRGGVFRLGGATRGLLIGFPGMRLVLAAQPLDRRGVVSVHTPGVIHPDVLAVVVFAGAWWLRARTPEAEPLTRAFFLALMVFSAGAGLGGWLLRLVVAR